MFDDILRNFEDVEFSQNRMLGVKRSDHSFSGKNEGHVKKVLEKNKEFFENSDIRQVRDKSQCARADEEEEGKQAVCAKSISDKVD